MTDKVRLLPCPFCGGKAKVDDEESEDVGGYFASCTKCPVSAWGDTQSEAITAWNTRTNTNAELVEALREAETVFSLVEHPAVPDPDYQARIEALGSQIGYGAIMAGASAAWRKCGIIPGGEFVAGPCQATVTRTLGMIRKALSLYSDRGEE